MARNRYRHVPPTFRYVSSTCHRSPTTWRQALAASANSGANRWTHRYTVTWSTSTPRSARSSSTSRKDRPNRRYQRTARVMTSGGKRYPAKADLGAGRTGGCRRDLIARVYLMPTLGANATVPRLRLRRRTRRNVRGAVPLPARDRHTAVWLRTSRARRSRVRPRGPLGTRRGSSSSSVLRREQMVSRGSIQGAVKDRPRVVQLWHKVLA